jgi:hypothetical protein
VKYERRLLRAAFSLGSVNGSVGAIFQPILKIGDPISKTARTHAEPGWKFVVVLQPLKRVRGNAEQFATCSGADDALIF